MCVCNINRHTAVLFVGSVAAVFDAVTAQRVRDALDGRLGALELVVRARDEARCPAARERSVHAQTGPTSITTYFYLFIYLL